MHYIEIIKSFYGIDCLQGCDIEEIKDMKNLFGGLPKVLEDYYLKAAKTEALHCVQDMWTLPEHFKKWEWLKNNECLILLNENQGVCRAGIRREDLLLQDPPVYNSHDDKNWKLCAGSTSEFLAAALTYEAVYAMEYTPEEYYELTEEEKEWLDTQLTKHPFTMQNWINDIEITFYSNAEDNLVVVMGCEGDWQMLYGAVSEASYDKLLSVVEDIGEPM